PKLVTTSSPGSGCGRRWTLAEEPNQALHVSAASGGKKAQARDDERRGVVEEDLEPRDRSACDELTLVHEAQPRAYDERDATRGRHRGAAEEHAYRLRVVVPDRRREASFLHESSHSRFGVHPR